MKRLAALEVDLAGFRIDDVADGDGAFVIFGARLAGVSFTSSVG